MYHGYAGKYIRVNLTDMKAQVFPLQEEWQRDYLGGVGMAAKIIWDEVGKDVDPLSPDNRLIFATGPVQGTLFPPSGRYEVVGRSPLTGWWGHASAGGFWGPELKYAGYDLIVIEGKASEPVYLYIDNDYIQLKPAGHLWGKNVNETTDMVTKENNDADIKVACIGQAGENLVRYACIMSDYYRAAGRTGLGAVMGSKNLKAIAVRGTKGIKIANKELFEKLVDDAFSRHSTKGRFWEYVEGMRKYGTFSLVDWENAIGRLPTKNHWTGFFENAEETIGMEPIKKRHYLRHKSCFNCAMQCKYVSYVSEGKYAGTQTEGPEYETIEAFGSNFLSTDTNAIMRANYLCNIFGMDTISAGHTISCAFECYEHGLIDKNDTNGRELVWGNDRMDTVIELLEDIAYRKGFGDLLAEGSKRFAEHIGKGAEAFAIHVNGMEASGQDGRPHKSLGLTYAINVRGADHLTSLSCIDELGFREMAVERYKDKADVVCDRWDETYKGYLVAEMEELYALCDSAMLCKYGVMWPPIYYFDDFGKIISSITGMSQYENPEELRKLAKRICHLRRLFNLRLGWTKQNDNLHPRFTKEPMPTGPAKGQVVNIEPMLKEYYEVRKYDFETGMPLKSELDYVGLGKIAENLDFVINR